MGLKLRHVPCLRWGIDGANRTKVGLKREARRAHVAARARANRTKVGLKHWLREKLEKEGARANRTKVGLKPANQDLMGAAMAQC